MLARQSFQPVEWLFRLRLRRPAALCLVWLLATACCLSPTFAQNKDNGEAEEPEEPEELVLETADGVRLAATYYPGNQGKDTVPIILLHMYKRDRKDYSQLAPALQKLGHAVLVPDLRGHGDSTDKKEAKVPLKAAGLSRFEFANMVKYDMRRLRAFLLSRNNLGKLNIEKLCVVGAEMGASVAINWAYFDWSLPTDGLKKQGQDVKALVLISPKWNTPGLPLKNALTRPPHVEKVHDLTLKRAFKDPDAVNFRLPVALDFRKEVSVLIVVGGGNSKAVSDARRLQEMLKPFHPDPPAEEKTEKQDLYFGKLDTSLQGTQMLTAKLGLPRFIERFIELRLVNRSFPWSERKNPYEGR